MTAKELEIPDWKSSKLSMQEAKRSTPKNRRAKRTDIFFI
jgi:hypothetical protein